MRAVVAILAGTRKAARRAHIIAVFEMAKQQEAFIADIAPLAQKAQRLFGVPASTTIAQAILESAWGKTNLARKYFNFFGIKARPGQGYCEFETAEYINGKKELMAARFERYTDRESSFCIHAHLLATLARYKPAMKQASSPTGFALQLQACGYSTDPNYAHKLMDLVAEFNLTQYDTPAPDDGPAKAKGRAA